MLLGVLVRHNRLNSEKRLKLACTPLKSLQAITIEIASNKFQAWWYVLCNVVDNSAGYNSMVFEPFLQFCFGPLENEPNIRSDIVDTTAHVKRFPDVSLMAVATFVRILGEPSPETNEIFKKYGLDQIDRIICTEKQFQNSLARLIINACGEATFMLTNLGDNRNNNANCCGLVSQLWQNLLEHVNRHMDREHLLLILVNVKQMLVAGAATQNDDREERTINLVKVIVAILIEATLSSWAISSDPQSHEILFGLLEVITMMPATHSAGLLVTPLIMPPTAAASFVQQRTQAIHSKFFARGEQPDGDALNELPEKMVRVNFRVWTSWAGAVQAWWQANDASVQKIREKSMNAFIDAMMECLLWPMTVLIDGKEVRVQ